MIKLWSIPSGWPNKQIGEIEKKKGTHYINFSIGKMLNANEIVSPTFVFKCNKKNMYDVLPNSGLLPLVSERVISLLLPKFGDSFQFFPADVWNKGVNITGYYIINITKTLHIMDLKKSKYSTMKSLGYPGKILEIERAVYKDDNLGIYGIVRNADYHQDILVDDKIIEIFKENKIKGVEFIG